MDLLNNLKIGTRLIALMAITSILLLIVGVIGIWGMQQANQALSTIYDRHLLSINQLQQIRVTQFQIRNDIYQARLARDGFAAQELFDLVDKRVRTINETLEKYQQQSLQEDEKKLLEQYVVARKDFGVNGIGVIRDLLTGEKFDEAEAHGKDVMDPAFMRVQLATDALIDHLTGEAGAYRQEIEKLARVLNITAIAGVAIGLALSIVLSLVIRQSIVRGARQLDEAASRLAQGDLSGNIAVRGNDEIAHVARTFNNMAGEFGRLIGEIRQAAGELDEAANHTTRDSMSVVDASNQQRQLAMNTTASSQELTHASSQVGENISAMIQATDRATDLARNGHHVVSEAAASIDGISQSVSQTAGTISSLGNHSEEIGRIVSVIKDIADQTNLLALNAAIEAARAGEQGRGFAVVADEVRKLAERTAKATGEISSTIQTIQNETVSAVTAMQRVHTQVEQGVDKTRQGDRAIAEITEAVAGLSQQIHAIDSIRGGQDSSCKDISGRIQEILDMASTNHSAAESSAHAAQRLNDLSARLSAAVSRFRLDQTG
ncbi:MAG: methyl-accepting chemotaxis protein [Betaproteobacteria bacterium]|nr:methyl-accepting chemotaxis protein [Betaproteobacteria bacterium]